MNYPVPDIREYDECIKQEDDLDTMLELRSSVNKKIRDLRKKSLVVLTVDEKCDEVDCEEVEHDKVS